MYRYLRLPARAGRTSHRISQGGRLNRLAVLLLVVTMGACGSGAADNDAASGPDLPEMTGAELAEHLAGLEIPAVVNVWASWCGPCRSEAPLLEEAYEIHGEEIAFIGVAVQDSQSHAKEFLSEFGIQFDQFFDRDRSVPNAYGGFGTPLTMFFTPGGELFELHNGVIDERTLALNIDELTRLDS